MDLLQWITDDLAGLRQKLYGSVANLVPAARWPEQSDGGGSSINHLMLHLARHQDLAVNVAIRNQVPLFEQHRSALGLDSASAGAGVAEGEDRSFTAALAFDPLMNYVTAVFDTTARWVARSATMALDTVPSTSRRLVAKAGIGTDEFGWLHEMWAGKTTGWLVQWPVIGHGHTHVGEMVSVRNRLGYSPF